MVTDLVIFQDESGRFVVKSLSSNEIVGQLDNTHYTNGSYVMNTKQAAIFLGCSEYKVKDMCRKREIPHLRYGNKPQGKIYFTQKALIQWLEKQERRNWR